MRGDESEEANKENVHYHYDLSNAFYALALDPEMVYSCAYFRDWNNGLATAQHDKLDMICRKLRLKPGDLLLDIGCGWGALRFRRPNRKPKLVLRTSTCPTTETR